MNRPWPAAVLAALTLISSTTAQPALLPGEALTYRVSWGIFFTAGEIKIFAEPAPAAIPSDRILNVTTTATRGFARALYAFDARAEALVEAPTGRLISHVETTTTKEKQTRHSTTLDYTKRLALYRDEIEPGRNLDVPLPHGDPLDLIMSLITTRQWDLKPGEKRDALVLFDQDPYELTIHAVRYEEITTRLGTFQTLVLEPRMDKTPPKGMFKRGSAVRVWIAQNDPRRLPVKFEVELKFGSGVATLVAYQPPAPPTQK
jgi:hypothetical protein